MTKQEFLEKLEKRLSILTDEEVEDILAEYGGYIDEKVKKKKMSESDAIREFGDFDELVKEILSAYKINDKKTTNSFDNFFESIGDTIEGIIKSFSNKDGSEITRMIVEIVLILIIIGIFRIPLEMIIDLGVRIFGVLPYPVDVIINGIWRFILELGYLILAAIFFLKIFKNKYIDGKISLKKKETPKEDDYDLTVEKEQEKKPSEKKSTEKNKKTNNSEKKEPVKVVEPKNNNDILDLFVKIMSVFAKFFLIIMLIPTFGVLLGIVIAFSLSITLLFEGVHYIGIILCLVATLSFTALMIEILIKWIFNKKNSATKIFVAIIIQIFLLGVGISLTAVEFASSSYINEAPTGFIRKTISETYDITKYNDISYWYDIEFIEDETMGDNIRIEVDYYEKFANPRVYTSNNTIIVDYYYQARFYLKDLYNVLLEDLKDKEFHNYNILYEPKVTIYGTKESIDTLRENSNNYKYNENIEYLEEEIERLEDENDELEDEVELWKEKYNDLNETCHLP